MNTSETNSQTPLRHKYRSPPFNFFTKNGRKMLNRSSNCQITKLSSQGHHSRRFKETDSFHVFPVVKTPPTAAKRFSKVINPFEAALAERLHLPLIGSPTLFQRPPSPQHSSTQFAWTIEDVSSLQPANVEPHETQFHYSPDPDYEAKAQSAISSYFKEQQIVPSPIDCPLRSQRIILSDLSSNTPISKPGRRIRDNVAQTVLSLPPTLPKDLEAALSPYFLFNECQQNTGVSQNISADSSINAIGYDVRDASLRRKLFDYQNVMYTDDDNVVATESCVLTVNSPPPQSPEVISSKSMCSEELYHNSKLSDSMDKSSFGSLSPIAQSLSPKYLKRKSRINIPNTSKTGDSVFRSFSGLYDNYRCPNALENAASPLYKKSPLCRFTTPDRKLVRLSSSPYRDSEVSIESIFNVKISGLLVDTAKRPKPSIEIDLFEDEAQDIDEDDMQVSQLSTVSNASSESDTPRSKRRSASRKNLSQSFSIQCSSNKDEDVDVVEQNDGLKQSNNGFSQAPHVLIGANCESQCGLSLLCRTDSGFNEMTTSSTQYDIKFSNEKTVFLLPEEEKTDKKDALNISIGETDVSMICCSTPSKRYAIP